MQHQKENLENVSMQLTIPSIHCQGCVDNISKAFTSIKGIAKVTGDPSSKVIELEYDRRQVKISQVKKVIQDLGHQLKSIKMNRAQV